MSRVLVLGNAGVDLVMSLPRLPCPGETLVGGPLRRAPGGKGLNQAVMAARSGARVLFCAAIGGDEAGGFVEAALQRENWAGLTLLRRTELATDTSVVMVAAGGENCIVTVGDCAEALTVAEAEAFAGGAAAGDVLLMQGNLSLAATVAAAQMGAARGALVMVNTAPLRWPMADVLASCGCVVANEGEAEALTGLRGMAAAEALVALGAGVSIVTMGAAGCAMAPGGMFAAPLVAVVDTSGAGDAFCGVLAAGLAAGMGTDAAVGAAQRAAADVVTRAGAFAALPGSFAL